MSAALAYVTSPHPTSLGQTSALEIYQTANDNHFLHLVDDGASGTSPNHSRSPALIRPDRARRPHTYDNPLDFNYGFQDYQYDADSDLKQLRVRWGKSDNSGHTGVQYRYDQDGSGKMIQQYLNASTWRYTPPVTKTVDYTAGGGTNALDQYAAIDMGEPFTCPPKPATCQEPPPNTQTYDGAGNLTSDGAGRTYVYNSENQMIRAQGPGLDMEYWYDAEGRRSHSLDHVADTEVFHKHYGQMEVGDYAVLREGGVIGVGKVLSYTPTFRIVLGAGVDERIAYYDVDGDDLFLYMTNHQGSTVSMVKSSTDATINGTRRAYVDGGRYVYDAYGNDTVGAPLTGNPYRYTGRRLDAQTGLYYYRARYYDPKQGRFLQTDPIGYADQMNLYGYVNNDPVNNTDPTGECFDNCRAWAQQEINAIKGGWKSLRGYWALNRYYQSTRSMNPGPHNDRQFVDTALGLGSKFAINNPGLALSIGLDAKADKGIGYNAGQLATGAAVASRVPVTGLTGIAARTAANATISLTGGMMDSAYQALGQLQSAGISPNSLTNEVMGQIGAVAINEGKFSYNSDTNVLTGTWQHQGDNGAQLTSSVSINIGSSSSSSSSSTGCTGTRICR